MSDPTSNKPDAMSDQSPNNIPNTVNNETPITPDAEPTPKATENSGSSKDSITVAPLREQKPATDISLISEGSRLQKRKKDTPSFFMMRGYQLLLVLALIFAFLLAMVYQTLFGRLQQPKQMVTIEQGQTYYGLLPEWQRQIPLFSSSIAKIYIKSQANSPLHAGTYQLPENPTFVETVNILQQGAKAAMVKVQIIEGKRAEDLYQTLRSTPGIKLEVLNQRAEAQENSAIATELGLASILPDSVQNSSNEIVKNNLEGWFAPDTYYYAEGTTDKKILLDLYDRQKQALDKAWASRNPNVPYQTPYEALVMASIIEKETSVSEERPMVSAVFANRIRKGMRLQTDPTIIYGMGSRYEGNIRRGDIDEKTAYNTYQIDGLPPTPIALPSAASIEATLHPADSDALYFVATGNGGHKFTNSLAEHNQAVREYLKVKRAQRSAEAQ